MFRLFSMGVALLWVSAMTALFVQDVWPAWTAQDPPPMNAEQFARLANSDEQFEIIDPHGSRMGRAWNHIGTAGGTTNINGTIVLDGITMMPPILIETLTCFDKQGQLDTFRLDVLGVPMTKIQVSGERRGIYFPCQLQVGTLVREASLDLAESRMIGESLRPFSYLPALAVGQSWRMQMIDPVSAVISRKASFTPIIARVTRKETIELGGELIECFVVETSPQNAVGWVDAEGRVVQQKVTMPGLGELTLRQEPFDARQREAARARVRRPRQEQGQD